MPSGGGGNMQTCELSLTMLYAPDLEPSPKKQGFLRVRGSEMEGLRSVVPEEISVFNEAKRS